MFDLKKYSLESILGLKTNIKNVKILENVYLV